MKIVYESGERLDSKQMELLAKAMCFHDTLVVRVDQRSNEVELCLTSSGEPTS